MDEKDYIKKTNNCVDEYADAFGYSSFGYGLERTGSIAFFKHVAVWPSDGGTNVENIKLNMATIRMPESLMLDLARFIIEQHEKSTQDTDEGTEKNGGQ
ncbi:hypothetical protein [Serratia marcescens]|uniref:hypothetical protein n=1 Tax=Serratia marcescens TaxID=615 RepID=UPI0005354E8D|nr:hypothetical protein [Serratia marcescens]